MAGDNVLPKMHLKQPAFTYSACGPFTENKERILKFKETVDTKLVFRMKWLMKILKIYQEEQLLIKS